MSLDLLVLVPLALGHLALFVVAMNVTHALGHEHRTMDRAKVVFLAAFVLVSAALAWEARRGAITAWSWPTLVYGSVCVVTGLIVFPAATAFLHHRPRPFGIEAKVTEMDFAATEGAENLIGAGKHAWMLRLPGNESLRLRTVECQVALPGLPPSLDGLSLLHVSDLHFAPCYGRRYFEAVADAAGAWGSDLVLFTGDLVDHDDAIEWVVPVVSRLRGRLGAFAILGNHDMSHHPDRLLGRLEEAGFTTLEGRWATVEANGATVALGGTSYPWGPPLPLADRPRADYHILLSHAPDRFYWAERSGFDLMLSGHNHGGQVRFPLVGAVFMPSVYSRRFDRGFFRKRGLTLHVSQGVAGNHPVRYGCVPEVSRLVLRSVPVGGGGLTGRPHGHGLTLSAEPRR